MDDIMRCHLTPSKNKSFVKNEKKNAGAADSLKDRREKVEMV